MSFSPTNPLALLLRICYAALHPLTDDISLQFAKHAHRFEHAFGHRVELFCTVNNKAAED